MAIGSIGVPTSTRNTLPVRPGVGTSQAPIPTQSAPAKQPIPTQSAPRTLPAPAPGQAQAPRIQPPTQITPPAQQGPMQDGPLQAPRPLDPSFQTGPKQPTRGGPSYSDVMSGRAQGMQNRAPAPILDSQSQQYRAQTDTANQTKSQQQTGMYQSQGGSGAGRFVSPQQKAQEARRLLLQARGRAR